MSSSAPPVARSGPGTVTLRFWAAARAAAGTAELLVEVAGPVTVADLVQEAVRRSGGPDTPAGAGLARVLGVCSALVGDRPVGAAEQASVQVGAGGTVEFLPPFAGG